MNKQLFYVVWIEGAVAFFIPFGSTLVAALAPYVAATAVLPSKVGWIAMLVGAGIAGASGLKSFLSTTVSDAKDELDAKSGLTTAPSPVDTAVTEQLKHPNT